MKATKGHWLTLPKGRLNARVLEGLTTYEYPDKTKISEIWDEGDSWVVPRELFTDEELETLGHRVVRVKGDYRPALQQTLALNHETAPTDRQKYAQKHALRALLAEDGGVVQLSPGSGKTALGLMAARWWAVPTLVVVHTADLQGQWVRRAMSLLGMREEEIGTIDGTGWNFKGKDLVVAIVHSLSAHVERHPDLAEFGTMIFDEVHHMKAPTFRLALPITSGQRMGISATPKVDGLENLFFHHIGPMVYLSEETDLSPHVIVKRFETRLSREDWMEINKFVYTQHLPPHLQEKREREVILARTMTAISDNQRVRQFIYDSICSFEGEGRHQLVLSDRVAQLERIYESFYGRASLLTGKIKKNKREEALHGSPIVCATTSLALEGLDRPEFDTLHVCFPWSGKNRLTQGFGRILRSGVDKQPPIAVLYDFVDVPMIHNMVKRMLTNCRAKRYSVAYEEIS